MRILSATPVTHCYWLCQEHRLYSANFPQSRLYFTKIIFKISIRRERGLHEPLAHFYLARSAVIKCWVTTVGFLCFTVVPLLDKRTITVSAATLPVRLACSILFFGPHLQPYDDWGEPVKSFFTSLSSVLQITSCLLKVRKCAIGASLKRPFYSLMSVSSLI